jgi:hypothetical protein
LQHFLAKELRRQQTIKRGGASEILSPDAEEGERRSAREPADLGELLLASDLRTGRKQGSYNVSLGFSHLLYELPDKPGKGFAIYGKGAIADGNPNPIQSSFVGGFAGHGVIPGRPRDVFGIGYYYYDLSNDLKQGASAAVNIQNE